jgi:hypothetical protein
MSPCLSYARPFIAHEVDSQAADGSLSCGRKSVYLRDSTVPYAHAIFYTAWSAGSLMRSSALPACWLHSRLPPSHPSVLL